jgi:formylglycine-generating enzyme required for sulfatase activity
MALSSAVLFGGSVAVACSEKPTFGDAGAGGAANGTSDTGTGAGTGGVAPTGCPLAAASPALVHVAVGDRAVCIDAYEVTRDQYQQWLKEIDLGLVELPRPLPCPGRTSYTPQSSPEHPWPPMVADAQHPVRFVDWCDAATYCRSNGRRLCGGFGGAKLALAEANTDKSEWYAVCAASPPVAARCNVGAGGGGGGRSVAVDAPTGCEGPPGVFHLIGNAFEWIDACTGADCTSIGGGYKTGVSASCSTTSPGAKADANLVVGFRCCADPIPLL